MSYILWKYFFDDDVDGFRQYLAKATFDRNASKTVGATQPPSFKIGSPGNLATSPKTPQKSRKSGAGKTILTRSDINARDGFGRTLLHHAASSRSDNALEFVRVLLGVPLLDLYIQDTESGWTALHRALYFGNIAAAQALMLKDIQNATDYTTNVSHTNAGGLVKIKDHEGNSPFEIFGLTTAPRDLQQDINTIEAFETASVQSGDMDEDMTAKARETAPLVDLNGDDIFAFGSNKNITLGLGDGDDRTFPERIQLTRPEHLMRRLFEDFQKQRARAYISGEISDDLSELQDLPAVIKNKPIAIQDVIMSKLHTAVLTRDPISNLHICGFGPGARLGTGDEATRFTFTCIQGGGLAKRHVTSVALGQDHTVAVCSSGEVFTWGANKYGQLGYELPEVPGQDVPLQLVPRQIYGLIKKEQIIGAAASSLHSAIYTASGLYTFGKNEGQLGLMDADARSLEIQIIPRRVGVSVLQHAIQAVATIDYATTVLLENHEVIVFTHYAWTKVLFPLDSFGSSIASDAFFARHKRQTKHISRITSGGSTICALTSYGEVFTIDVPRHVESVPSKSTTNPSKAKNALPTPSKVWSIRKSHMAATDVAVGQDGSIILCTATGTVWKKEKRANIKSVHSGGTKPKLYKFIRVPNIFGAIAVRSNSFGAFMAIRRDFDIMKQQIVVEPPNLWTNVFNLLAFRDYGDLTNDENADEPHPRFWNPAIKGPCPALIKRTLLLKADAEEDFIHIAQKFTPLSANDYDVWITSNVTDVRLPVHSLLLKARSKVLRRALAGFAESYYFSIPDTLAIEYGVDGQIQLLFNGADFLTIANFVLYIYSDTLADVWRFTSRALHLAPRYRAVRTELMKIATALEMKPLERAVRVMDDPLKCMRDDFEAAFHDSDLFSDADVVIDLADGEERYAHSVILQSRCPFFQGLFQGHTGGMWMADRRNAGDDGPEAVHVDLKHIDVNVFEIVLRYIYADTAEELFDAVTAKDLDEFIDLVIEVMSVANELMLERLERICQKVVGYYVTPWNVCGLLNTISESSEVDFKLAGLEYIGLNLENILEQRLLEELDEHLLEELDESVQSNQLAFMPIARSDRGLEMLLEQNPLLAESIEQGRQRRLDSMRLPSRYVLEAVKPNFSTRVDNRADLGSNVKDGKKAAGVVHSPLTSPVVTSAEEFPFEMDDDGSFQTSSKPGAALSLGQGMLPVYAPRPSLTRHKSSQSMQDEQDDDDGHSVATTPQATSFTSSVVDPSKNIPRAAWGSPTPTSPGIGLKDIMLQDSSSKISNLTTSLKQAAVSSKQTPSKISQRERKRQQHEQKLQSQAQTTEVQPKVQKQVKPETAAPQSPWQKVTTQATPIAQQDLSQTAEIPKTKPVQAKRKEKPTEPIRSVSSPGMSGVSSTAPPQIQSIRHTPTPNRSTSWVDARTSMADILAQQQFEKVSVRENLSKRSLQEIQQEQEFQEWWDKESQRVQEEEAAAANASATRRGKASRGGKKKSFNQRETRSSEVKPTKSNQIENVEQARGESSQRGRHRGRGDHRRRSHRESSTQETSGQELVK